MSRSTNRQGDPGIYFRIMHSAQVGRNVVPVETYREQTVEVAVKSKGGFENGNIGTLMRRVPPDRVLNVIPPAGGDPKTPPEPRTPRVVELLCKAIERKALLDSGQIGSQADIVSQEGITCARVTQVMGLLRLAPEIREKILSMPKAVGRSCVTERVLRPITALTDHRDQLQEFQKLLEPSMIALRPRSAAGLVTTGASRNTY